MIFNLALNIFIKSIMESQSSTTGLIVISNLYKEGLINDEDRDKLKGKYIVILRVSTQTWSSMRMLS